VAVGASRAVFYRRESTWRRFDTLPSSIEYIRAGKLRALAVSTLARSQALPDLPSVSEFVPGYESSGFFGVGAPAKTSSEIVDKLNKEINAGLADAKLKAQLADLGGMTSRLACRFQDPHCRRN
jgi:tripartite-type tricarboxylate transporter receptor subunit TctC